MLTSGKATEEILGAGIFEEDETDFVAEIKAEIAVLRSRVSKDYKDG